jgi:hypothetical protein
VKQNFSPLSFYFYIRSSFYIELIYLLKFHPSQGVKKAKKRTAPSVLLGFTMKSVLIAQLTELLHLNAVNVS